MSQVGATSYHVGQRPRFELMVTNIGGKPCTRDLNPWLQNLVVTGPGQAQLWSSNDCSPVNHPDVRTLQPGTPASFSVEWQGRTSAPGCGLQRAEVGPGSYALIAKLGSLSSGPAPFTMLPAAGERVPAAGERAPAAGERAPVPGDHRPGVVAPAAPANAADKAFSAPAVKQR